MTRDFFRKHGPEILFYAALAVLLIPNAGLSITEPMTIASRIVNILLPGGLYILLMSVKRNPAKSVWISFLLIFLSAFQLVLLFLFGDSIIAVDMFLNLVTTNASEAGELLGSLVPAMITVGVVYVPLLIAAGIYAGKKGFTLSEPFLRRSRRTGAAVAASGLCIGAICMICSEYKPADDLYPYNVCYNIGLAVDRSVKTSHYAETSADFTYGAVSTHAAASTGREVYVLVIGETARADNFGLFGYGRDTNPLLSSTEGVIGFPHAYTQSNTTHKSVPMLMSSVTAETFNDIYHRKGVITAFKEAGFNTAFVSNQRPNHSFIDFFGAEADYHSFIKEEKKGTDHEPSDMELLQPLDSLLGATDKPLLIVLHTYGSHFKYSERYPREAARFLPDTPDEALASNRATLIKSYDNTILFTDSVLHSIIMKLDSCGTPAAMLYVSDHGENIFDTPRGLFLHASPRPSAYELHVPMIAWLSPAYRRNYPEETKSMEENSGKRIITSVSLFHTLAGLAGVSTPYYTDSLSAASPEFREIPHMYLSDRNIAVPVEKIVRK